MISSPARGSHFSPLERLVPSPVKIGDAGLLRFKELQGASPRSFSKKLLLAKPYRFSLS
jgi:hypothetical protein